MQMRGSWVRCVPLQPPFQLPFQLEANDLFSLELEELINLKISSVTLIDQNLDEIPGTVYVYTQKDFIRYGWHDLKDVLFHLPGVEFGYGHSWLQGGQRGIARKLVKSKITVDGLPYNLLYTEAYIGNQFDLSHVKRVELIQGPSSVIFGQMLLLVR